MGCGGWGGEGAEIHERRKSLASCHSRPWRFTLGIVTFGVTINA